MIRRLVFACLLLASICAEAQTVFTVDSTTDLPDAVPGDGACAAAGGACTLRAALMEARAPVVPIADVSVRLPPGIYALSHVAGDLSNNPASGDLDMQPVAASVTLAGWVGGGAVAASQRPVITAAAGFPRRLLEAVGSAGQAMRLRDLVFADARPVAWDAQGVVDNGAAIQCRSQQGATLELERVSIVGNEVPGAVGSAIYSAGCNLVLTDTEIDGNCGRGGALVSGPSPFALPRDLRLKRVSLTRNDAGCTGLDEPQHHAIAVQSNLAAEKWSIQIADSTLGENLGGMLLAATGGVPSDLRKVSLRNVTVHGNAPDYLDYDGVLASGDIDIEASHAILGAQSHLGAGARLRSMGYVAGNIVGGPAFTPHATDLGLAPLSLQALQATGPYTQGFPPGEGSLAVDSGAIASNDMDIAACTPRDQADTPRPQGVACDIGAMELVSVRLFANGFE